ncbi:MAG TPA: helix-turn-helix transcriptional regulator [Thermomicrobiales bacterium]|nr:helix-turn-helix transcriptional regulator [Thermomicrobiales bacterium]
MAEAKHVADHPAATGVSPSGTTAAAARARRMAHNPEYRREWNARSAARDIAWQVVKYRMDHHLTQEELARRVGTSHAQISRIENGQHLPSVQTLARLADALGLELTISFTERSRPVAAN